MRELTVNQDSEIEDTRRSKRLFRFGALLVALGMVASACGSSSDTENADAATAEESSGEQDDGSQPAEGDANTSATISWTAPDGMEPAELAVSPDGSHVAIGFTPPLGLEVTGAEIVVFDVTSGEEAWRASIDDAGVAGLGGMMFTTTGVSFYRLDFDGTTIVTLGDGGAVLAETPIDSECQQFLNGTVHPNDNVAYTVVPGGFCRVDLSSGEATSIRSSDLSEGAELVDSIRYDAADNLVATFKDVDFVAVSLALNPTTMASNGPAPGEPEPLGDLYRDRLIEGLNLSSGTRVASSPDRSVIALLQPGSIEVLG